MPPSHRCRVERSGCVAALFCRAPVPAFGGHIIFPPNIYSTSLHAGLRSTLRLMESLIEQGEERRGLSETYQQALVSPRYIVVWRIVGRTDSMLQ